MTRRTSKTQKKLLILLLGGLSLGLTPSPKKHIQVIKEMHKEWVFVSNQSLERSIESLYVSRLISKKRSKDGTTTLILTKLGRQAALTYDLENMRIEVPKKWDKKWRIVIFDIPEPMKKVRDAFRSHLRILGFYELQKSVLVYPYKCSNEIEYIISLYNIGKYVRFIVATSIDNQEYLGSKFNL